MVAVMILRLSRMIASTLTMRLQVQNSTQGGGLSRGGFPGQQGCCKVLFPHPPKKRNKVGTPHAPAKGCALCTPAFDGKSKRRLDGLETGKGLRPLHSC